MISTKPNTKTIVLILTLLPSIRYRLLLNELNVDDSATASDSVATELINDAEQCRL